MIRAIFFDLDDTLLDFGMAERVAVAKAFRAVGVEPDEALLREYSAINDMMWKKMELGQVSRDALLVERFDILFQRHQIPVEGRTCEDAYRQFLGIGHYFVEGAEEILAYLAPKYDLYLASNGVAATQYSRLQSAGIGPYFRQIFISETTGFHKPEPGYYDFCFHAIGDLPREQALMLGDRLSSDILGGKRAGMQTCWFNPRRLVNDTGVFPDMEIHALAQLKTLL